MAGRGEQEATRLLQSGLELLGLAISGEQVARLASFCVELEKWNRKVNLLAKDTPLPDIIDKHVLDSLTLVPLLDRLLPEGGAILDVGSGAGFPGIPLTIARPLWHITLLEPRERRVIFLRHIIRAMDLSGIKVEPSRIEEGRLQAAYQVITGRAVAEVPLFLSMVEGLAAPETRIICMQGEGGRQELRPGNQVGDFVCS